jgi:hypothetical protein
LRVQNDWSETSGGVLVSAFEELGSLAFGSPREYNALMDQDPAAVAEQLWQIARRRRKNDP